MQRRIVMIFLLTGTMLVTGCGTKSYVSTVENKATAAKTVESVTKEVAEDHSNGLDTSDMFTDRDKEIGYDEERSAVITLADDNSSCASDAVQIEENTITIIDEGTYLLSGELTDGMIIVDAEDKDKVQLVLDGADITSEQSAAIYVRCADKVFIATADGSENTLTNGGTYTAIDDNNIDAVIFSKDDLTLNGTGTLNIHAAAGHGVVSKDNLVLTSGTYGITAQKHGLSGKDSVRIAEGSYHITAGQDGIHASNTDDTSLGFIYIAGGTFEITSPDDGMHADSALMIEGGTIHVLQSYEGLEGLSIDITGGDIEVTSEDDGLNAAGGNDSSGTAGRKGDIFAAEEGAYIHISGGIFAATGSSGMAQNFGNSSTQGVMMVTVDTQTAQSLICLKDSSGNELISWTADTEYTSVIVSCPEITQGSTYTLTAGNSTQEITMDSLVYGSSGMGGMGGRQGGGMPGQGKQPRDGMPGQDRQPGSGAPGQDGMPEDGAPGLDGQPEDSERGIPGNDLFV